MDVFSRYTDSPFKIKARKTRQGPENDLVQSFLESFEEMFSMNGLKFSVFIEPYLDIGFPDIIGVAWNPESLKFWSESRLKITAKDIRILNHLSLQRLLKSENDLLSELGYSKAETVSSLCRLMDANLITSDKDMFKSKKLNEIFIPHKIIAIEAKMADWKHAFRQARLNQWFASESYVLFPGKDARKDLLECSAESEVGLIIGDKVNPFKKVSNSTSIDIPTSYGSWIINEWLGRFAYSGVK